MKLYEFYPEQLYEVKDSSKPGVLATMSGPFFFPELPSRNGNRLYPKKAWENALGNQYTKRLLDNGLMLGTVGHKELEFDELISEQKVSHVTRTLSIVENNGKYPEIKSDYVGIGEADILDTPVGRILNTLIRANCKLGVSSKAYGDYSGGKNAMGGPTVDENKFFCQRFDFVVDPGYLEAMPSLKEEYEKIFPIKEDTDTMDKEMQKLLEDKINTEHQLDDVLKSNKDLSTMVESFKVLGTIEQLKETLTKIKTYESIGTVEEITETLEGSKDLIKEYQEIGTVEEIKEALEGAKAYITDVQEIGTVQEIREALEASQTISDQLEDIGSVEEIRETLEGARDLIVEYQDIGTVEEITEAFEMTNHMATAIKETNIKSQVEEITSAYGISEEKARKYLDKSSLQEVKELLDDIMESTKVTTRYSSKNPLNEDKKEHNVMNESRSSRLYGNFTRKV